MLTPRFAFVNADSAAELTGARARLEADMGGGANRLDGVRCLAAVALSSLLGACSGAPRSPPAGTTRAEVLEVVLYAASHPCPGPGPGQSTMAAGEQAPELYLEAVLLDVPLNAATQARTLSLKQLVDLPDLRLLGSPQLSGKFDATTTFDLEQHFGGLEQATLNRISFMPRHGEPGQLVINLELGFSLPNADPAKNPQTASASLLVVAPYRQPTLGFVKHPDDPRRQLVAIVNVYPLRSVDDFRTLFECKMRLRQHEIEHQNH